MSPNKADRKCVLYFHWQKQTSNQDSVFSFCYTLGNYRINLHDYEQNLWVIFSTITEKLRLKWSDFCGRKGQASTDLDTNSRLRFSISRMVSCWMMLSMHQELKLSQLFCPWTLVFLFSVHPTNLFALAKAKKLLIVTGESIFLAKKQSGAGKDPVYPHCLTRPS